MLKKKELGRNTLKAEHPGMVALRECLVGKAVEIQRKRKEMHTETCVTVHQRENGRKGRWMGKGLEVLRKRMQFVIAFVSPAKQGTGCSRMREPA